jgi:transketolase
MLPLWGINWKQIQAEQLANFDEIISVEDHLADGGFGSFLLESTAAGFHQSARLTIKALDSRVCGMVGSQNAMWDFSNFYPSSLV